MVGIKIFNLIQKLNFYAKSFLNVYKQDGFINCIKNIKTQLLSQKFTLNAKEEDCTKITTKYKILAWVIPSEITPKYLKYLELKKVI